ncbi:MAG TPA: adenylate/guanylate cyclase domain-containing protein [Acidimicrobiales bacterium]|nr:adenylate/guanylate cyclase domain-containing protein [Acidimicrobiales bacterium]
MSASTRKTPGSLDDSVVAVAERRLCSVLFVDLVGFTPYAEQQDPESVRELLTQYFDRAQSIIESYGGTIEKFIGDAVMAVWGAPVANEDDAERAVRAGLDVIASVSDLGEVTGNSGLRARGGVATGEVAITIGKVSEGMVLGDTVNSASRVQSVAEPGTVFVDESTWRAASGAIAFEEVGTLELKGKAVTINAWRALRVVAQRKGLGRAERLEPPFVGREEEIRLIKDLLHATAREKRARLVSVTGIPGIGKSRLAWEFLKYVDGLADNVYWHEGRSRAYGEGITFGALGEIVRMRAGILEVEDATSSLAKLQECLTEFVRDDEERLWILPHLAHLLGLADAPSSNRDEIFSAWRMFFERIAEQGLTVLIFEDLQWADAGLIDFVESILEWSKGCSILIVTLARPELIDRRPSWGAGLRNFTSLHLEPLSASSMNELLNGFVHGLPSEVADRVLQRAEGVPLYAVETIRMLVDRGVIVQVEDGYEVQAELGTLEIPETLHALIASRLDSLTPRQRALLQDAGIVGSTFSIESLRVVSDESAEELEIELRDLVRKEYVFADNDPRSPERGQFGFVQGVIREVAVGTLARRDRQAKHAAVARYVESLGEEELAGVIASHYIEAYRASPDESGNEELLPKALEWLDRAGQRALSLGSPDQAAVMFDQAIDLAPDDDAMAPLLERASKAATHRQHYESAVEYLYNAIDIYHAQGDLVSWGLCVSELCHPLMASGRAEELIELSERAFELVGEDETRVRAKLSLSIAMALGHGTEVERAVEWCEIALRLAEELDDDALLAGALGTRSLALFTMGRHREAVMLARGMASIADDAGELFEQARARTGLSLYMLPDNPRGMVEVANEAVELARRAGTRGLEITNMLNITETSLYLGLWDEGFAMVEELHRRELPQWHREWLAGLEAVFAALGGDTARADELLAIGSESGDRSLASLTTRLTMVAFVALAKGELDDALREANRAVDLDPMGINCAAALGIAARAALWMGNLDELRGVFAAMHKIRGRAMAAQRRTAEAGIAALEGRFAESADIYLDAIEQWRAVESVLDLALCELDLTLVLGKDHEEATAAKEARDIFVQIGAHVFVQRLAEITDLATD